jgi:outer membrane protein OmpA-like peptidoglycan-associated protein
MAKKIVVLIAAGLLANSGWTAPSAGSPKEERIGVGSGAAVGALAGPLGVVLGATVGAWLGDKFHAERSAREDFEARWSEARAEVDSLHGLLGGSEQQLAALERELGTERAAQREALQRAFDLQVLFRTAASSVEQESARHLARLGQVLAPIEGVVVHLDGYADARGDERYNQQLSADRATAVKDILVAAGLPAERILVSAQGESGARAAENDTDALALDRRVHLTVLAEPDADRVARE